MVAGAVRVTVRAAAAATAATAAVAAVTPAELEAAAVVAAPFAAYSEVGHTSTEMPVAKQAMAWPARQPAAAGGRIPTTVRAR